jgi:hypothetical protein
MAGSPAMKFTVRSLVLLLPLVLASGCMTQKLWTNGTLETWNQPAANPNLHLFAAAQKQDVLVVYDEYSERHDATHARAYGMKENDKLINDRRKPHFVSTTAANGLKTVPILSDSTDPHALQVEQYALVCNDGQAFKLCSGTADFGSHSLPVYNDHVGKMEKAALTPVTATADLTIVGGIAGLIYLEARSGAPIGLPDLSN